MDTAGGQIQGARRRQEDAFAIERIDDGAWLAVVADGLGGHPRGDLASREGIAAFLREFSSQTRMLGASPRRWLERSVRAADQRLRSLQAEYASLRGMATTLVALYASGRQAYALSVGDSYLMVLRGGVFRRLNKLHVLHGAVTSCVGFALTRVELSDALATAPGDRFVLATDGIATLSDEKLKRIVADAGSAGQTVSALLGAVEAAANPAQDNATAVTLFVP